MGFSPPTAAITCPHGALAPESLTKHSKRIAIPADFWAFLQRSWQLAELERERKVRARRAAAARKADGGAAVIDATPVKKQEDREGDGGNDVVMMDAEDGKTGASLPEVVDIHDDEDEVLEGPSEKKGGIDAEAEHANGNGNGNVDDTGTGSEPLHEFPITSDECPVCLSEMHAAASLSKGLHSRREAERADLAHLVNPTLVNLTPGQSYRLVPAAFMHLWRAYMAQAGGRGATSASTPGEVVQPPSLVASMAGVACSCHPGPPDGPLLAHPPPGVVNRRGRWVLANEEEGAFEVVSVSDWEAIVIHYLEDGMAFGPEGIQATLLVDTLPGPPAAPAPGEAGGANGIPAAAGPSSNPSGTISMADISPEKGSDMLESKEQGPGGSKAGETAISPSVGAVLGEPDVIFGGDGDANPYDARPRGMAARAAAAGYGWLEPHPAVCAAAVAQREEAAKAARLTYVAQEVMVETCPTDEEAKAATAAAAAAAAAGADGADVGGAERRSKRARKGRAPVVVDCTTTLCDLRLRIFEALGVHPRNARLFLRGKVLEAGDDSTMAGCEIYPGEEIRVVDTGEHDANDLVGLFPGGARREGRETRQEGFGGTALVSHTGAGSAKAQKEELLSPSDNEQR